MLVSVLNQWLAQFIIVYSTPYMMANIKYGTFYFFVSVILISGVAVYFFMPETKGFTLFTLEEVDLIFDNGHLFAPRMRARGEQSRAERAGLPGVDELDSTRNNGDNASIHECEAVGN